MLQLSRRNVCRFTSSYVCASCLATPHSPSVISRRPIVVSRHVRPLSTTIARRESASPATPNAASDMNTGNVGPPPPPPPSSSSSAPPPKKLKKVAPPTKREAAPAKRDAAPTKKDAAPPIKKGRPSKHHDNAEHQLKMLQGAVAALKNVLEKQGVDVGQILGDNSQSNIPGSNFPIKLKQKMKSKNWALPALSADLKEAEPKGYKEPKEHKEPKEAKDHKEAKEAKEPEDHKEAKDHKETKEHKEAKEAKEPEPKKKAVKAKAAASSAVSKKATGIKAKTKFVDPKISTGSPKKAAAAASRRAASAAKRKAPTEQNDVEAMPADLGVPFDETATPFDSKSSKKRNLPAKIDGSELSLVPIETIQPAVASLSYGLERVLFNPGVYHLQDPRSRVYNFDPYLSQIMPVNEFDFNALKEYITSSRDNTLINIAKENKKRYTGSTSSMTSMLAHFHFLLSAWRDININMLTKRFVPDSLRFTRIMRAPAAIFLHWKDGTYAIDADKEFDSANILSMLGKSMEKLLTLSTDDYERYRHGNSDQITEEERNASEAYHYTGFQDFMMRSQLDAYDSRVPGSGMFDLKTRAVISIRMDAKGYEKGLGYEIRGRYGQWESFEREYYDMIRSAFLKYSLQVRMGRMDGIFVAYHNIQRIFGFQYIPLNEMDMALHGTNNLAVGDQEFMLSLNLLNEILNRATKKWPERSLRLHFETRESTDAPFMYIFAEPTTAEEISAVQNANKASVEAFERSILGLVKAADEGVVETPTVAEEPAEEDFDDATSPPAQEMDTSAAWQEARQMVEKAIGDDELGVALVREAIADALEQSGILRARSLAESREYVDALMQALTGGIPSTQAEASAVESHADIIDEDAVEESVTHQLSEKSDQSPETSESEETPQVASEVVQSSSDDHDMQRQDSETTTVETSKEPSADEKSAAPTPDETNDAEEEDVEDEEASEDAELESDHHDKEPKENVSSLEALKGLIMRMARGIGEGESSGMDASDAREDASKLKEFERIFGHLISQSKIEQPKKENEDEKVDQIASTESESTATDAVKSESNEDGSAADAEGEEESSKAGKKGKGSGKPRPEKPLLLLTLTIKNKLNGSYIRRVTDLLPNQRWTVEYEIQEVEGPRAMVIYEQLKTRRRKIFEDTGDKEVEWYRMWAGELAAYTKKGRSYRAEELKREKKEPMHMVGADEPLRWEEVFSRSKNLVKSEEEPSGVEESQESETRL